MRRGSRKNPVWLTTVALAGALIGAGCERQPAAGKPAGPAASAAPSPATAAASAPAASASSVAKAAPAGSGGTPKGDAGAPKGPACAVVAAWSARVPSASPQRALKVIFYDDGRVSWNRSAGTFTGTWKLDGTHLVVTDTSTEAKAGCGAAAGHYTPVFGDACATMRLAARSDGCAERRGFASSATFTRVP